MVDGTTIEGTAATVTWIEPKRSDPGTACASDINLWGFGMGFEGTLSTYAPPQPFIITCRDPVEAAAGPYRRLKRVRQGKRKLKTFKGSKAAKRQTRRR